ncbi:recombinase family protein [Sphingomonas sp. CFBP 13720]|uniref:recombinase family protein n=1 Tax=Sphingomonas sp. CFBP 13720 TaxID=2775302 RepID=UPI0017820C67|nr:recombinase family protein [Sphingomonas sp. CFBP 13720]MBD8677554.1 recombinase family protein [Sphingomonas sp. CFBP 13720]
MYLQPINPAPRTPASQPKVYSYSRWSTPEQSKGDSSRRQADAADRWAARHGYQLDLSLSITDEGVSAFRGTNAVDGGLSRFLEACRRGLIEDGSFLLVESLDRISRMAPRKAQRLIDDIVDNGVTIVTLSDDQHYTAERLDTDPTALLIALMVSWRAHEESKTKGRRVAEAWDAKRQRVRANPAERLTKRGPSWLIPTDDGRWAVDAPKAAVVRRIFAMALKGIGEHGIAATLQLEGVPMLGRGKHWHRSTVSKVLRNPAVIGTLIPGQIRFMDGQRVRVHEQAVPGAFPAVVTEADWLAVRALKDGNAHAPRGRNAGRTIAHVFAGLARCPLCGSAMGRVNKGAPGKAGVPKLVCSSAKAKAGCRYVSVPAEQVEAAFLQGWAALLDGYPTANGGHDCDEQRRNLEAAIWGTEDHLENLSDALKREPLQATMRKMGRVQAELRSMRTELEALEQQRAMADRGLIETRLGNLQDLIEHEDGPDRAAINAALKVLLTGVVVDFGTGRLRFQWRQGGETALLYAWVD